MSAATLALPAARLPARNGRAFVQLQGRDIALFDVDGCVYAVDDSCPHAGASLARGRLQGRTLQCPAHGLKFDLASGHLCNVPGLRLTRYALQREGEQCLLTPLDPDS
jgi:nitrite reductase/ring-hydroxylating ferredoxin subunit